MRYRMWVSPSVPITRMGVNFDAFLVAEPEIGAEQPHPVAEQPRGDVQFELVHQPERQRPTHQPAATGDLDVLATGMPLFPNRQRL